MKKFMASCMIFVLSASAGFTQSNCLTPTNLQLQYAYDTQVGVEWNETSDAEDSVALYKILYRPLGETVWYSKMRKYLGNQSPMVKTRLKSLIPDMKYEMKIRAEYKSGCISAYSPVVKFQANKVCPNVSSLSVVSPKETKAVFSWNIIDSYSFVRIKLRENIPNSTWFYAGGLGVNYPRISKAKNGLIAGQSYRAVARTWCDPNGGVYRSPTWTSFISWTQPSGTQRLAGIDAVKNLKIYPNPSRNTFNISFISEEVQQLKVRVINLMGKEIINDNLEQFVGEYTKKIDLTSNARGIYFLEIETKNGIVNKKLLLQ